MEIRSIELGILSRAWLSKLSGRQAMVDTTCRTNRKGAVHWRSFSVFLLRLSIHLSYPIAERRAQGTKCWIMAFWWGQELGFGIDTGLGR